MSHGHRIQRRRPLAPSSKRSPRCVVASYSTRVVKNILWVWPWTDTDPLSVAADKLAQPEGFLAGVDEHASTYAGFTVVVTKPTPAPSGVLHITFRRIAASITDDIAAVSYVRGSAAAGGSCADGAGGQRAGCAEAQAYAAANAGSAKAAAGAGGDLDAEKNSWAGRQVASYYMRAAQVRSK